MAELTALSPSRANDFLQCPLKFRFRSVDRLPEPPSPAAFKGTLVHAVLEQLFDAESERRTYETALALLPGCYEQLTSATPELAEMYPDEQAVRTLLGEAAALLRAYFGLELPDRLEPAERESFVTVTLDSGLELRGFIDRVDVAPGGQVRLVDYKTGKQPRPQYGREADFQMRFYALLRYRRDGVLVHTLQLMYLGSGSIKSYRPTLADIERTEAEVRGIWDEITSCARTGNWRPQKSKLCDWCSFKELCPAWGNQAPAAPEITRIAGTEVAPA
ncbi:RecB family exonuclease [Brevibacterium daeguense]|uniref:RecB family exonuclease n=1 Tax=Brevibacterium daeguense TaxID=909936 RepID=A0ABP8ENE9_9MICO|nr:PD-(D/E)XK nuclease family protein [Brevibacterium daeguense]